MLFVDGLSRDPPYGTGPCSPPPAVPGDRWVGVVMIPSRKKKMVPIYQSVSDKSMGPPPRSRPTGGGVYGFDLCFQKRGAQPRGCSVTPVIRYQGGTWDPNLSPSVNFRPIANV